MANLPSQTLGQANTFTPVQDYTPEKQSPSFSSVINQGITVSTLNTAGALTYTAAQVFGGLILRDPNGAARADLFPTAANLVPLIEGAKVGSSFVVTIRNTADAAETITMTTNTGVTISGTATIAQNNQKAFLIVVTAIGAVPTYTAYSLGTVVF